MKTFPPNKMLDTLLYGRILFQQFVISCWIKIEEQRLQYLYANQNKLKTEIDYAGRQVEKTGITPEKL
jgi:hypothetical protein